MNELKFFGGTFVITIKEKNELEATFEALKAAKLVVEWPVADYQKDIYMRKIENGRYEPVIETPKYLSKEAKERAQCYEDANADMDMLIQEASMKNVGVGGWNFSDL